MQNFIVLALVLVLVASLVPDSLARPFTQNQRRQMGKNSRLQRRDDVDPFPDGIPTSSSNNDFTVPPCRVVKTKTYETENVTVEECCEGYYGDDCDKKVPQTAEAGSGEDDKPAWDPADPCKNLECHGVEQAQCLTISKCGERWPVFLLPDGTLAQCTNGQPVNVTRFTCSDRCTTDPCAGRSCSAFPDAFCVHTACDCNEPMWLLDTGVQVDCETGEQLSPEEAKERKRRRKRQATNAPPTSTSSCS